MLHAIDSLYIMARIRMKNFVQTIREDETGVSGIVATVLLVLVTVLLAAMFWDKISQWFDDTWDKITDNDTIGNQ